jgi:DNA modification methylase
VLDPFLGSGTTTVAAQALERSRIGIEVNPHYVEMTHQRLDAMFQVTEYYRS